MSDLATVWTPQGPWSCILPAGHLGAPGEVGIVVTARDGLGMASLIVAEGGEAALAQSVKAHFGLDLPSTPRAARSATHALVWAGPGQWLLIAEDRSGFAEDLAALSHLAAVADQSDSRAALRLSGTRIRDALAKGCMLDLHASAFPPGFAALTSIAHISVHLWRVDDGPDDEAVFEIMVPRSVAGSFWSWLSASAAEFGCTVATTGRG
jgi:methylglutamate dehydrogenase subunit D